MARDEARADVPADAVPADASSLRGDAVGRVLGTQAASPLSFWVGLEPGSVLQLDDVVVTWRDVPGRGRVLVAGVVTNVEARYEGGAYDSDGGRTHRVCASHAAVLRDLLETGCRRR